MKHENCQSLRAEANCVPMSAIADGGIRGELAFLKFVRKLNSQQQQIMKDALSDLARSVKIEPDKIAERLKAALE